MMRLSEAAIATRGQLIGKDVAFTSVGTDSRALVPEQLFVALRGEKFDGHSYASQALEQGAAAVMVSDKTGDISPALQVKDTRLALGDLAAHWRGKFKIPLAAITGSSGKTTVKEMLATILRVEAGNAEAVLATQGNLNNDIGLPLTLLNLRQQHRYAVAEMGMNHIGEIGYLSKIGRPTVALINNAGTAHIEHLGSVEAIARAKGEIFQGLAADGVAVINADDPFEPLWRMLSAPRKVITFGLDHAADVSAEFKLEADASVLDMKTPRGKLSLRLPAPGLHNVRNALAATAAALAMDASLQSVERGLAGFAGAKGRLQYKLGRHDACVIDDTYNANPVSMKAAIDVLAAYPGKKLLVLGDMGELGAAASQLHAEIGAYAKQAGLQGLYTLGELSREMVAAYGQYAWHYDTPEALAAELVQRMTAATTVLVKGSRFMRMERVVALITAENKEEKH
ncbi:MAG TPA: UDP-N-acetylmuramoyl-tripeptide--D-alanyl-D-alanine ligase [Methylophilaceae bacterium]|jgi:UDP-N-acetylmuramoyl-tripeptide--D-alanyl-D-alanine ligase